MTVYDLGIILHWVIHSVTFLIFQGEIDLPNIAYLPL